LENPALLEFIGEQTPQKSLQRGGADTETLGGPQDSRVLIEGLAAAIQKQRSDGTKIPVGNLVRTVFTPESRRFDREALPDDQEPDQKQLSADGEQLALLLYAAIESRASAVRRRPSRTRPGQ